MSAAAMLSLEKHEGWGNQFVVLHEAANAGRPGWSYPKRETSFAFRLKRISTGKAGAYRSKFGKDAKDFVCTLCKYRPCVTLGMEVRIAGI
jgi:hypothetical protein